MPEPDGAKPSIALRLVHLRCMLSVRPDKIQTALGRQVLFRLMSAQRSSFLRQRLLNLPEA